MAKLACVHGWQKEGVGFEASAAPFCILDYLDWQKFRIEHCSISISEKDTFKTGHGTGHD
jgi:hypothetical protein